MEKLKKIWIIQAHAEPILLEKVLDEVMSVPQSLTRQHWMKIFSRDLTEFIEKEVANGNVADIEQIDHYANFYLGEVYADLLKGRKIQGGYTPIYSLADSSSSNITIAMGISEERGREMVQEMNKFLELETSPKKYSAAIQKASYIAKTNQEFGFLVYIYTTTQHQHATIEALIKAL